MFLVANATAKNQFLDFTKKYALDYKTKKYVKRLKLNDKANNFILIRLYYFNQTSNKTRSSSMI